MDSRSRALFTETIKQAIFKHLGLLEQNCSPLDGFESFFYKAQLKGEPCALRISHSIHRSPIQIRGEIEWMAHLSDHGIQVPRALPLPCGDVLISVSDGQGGAFTAVCFSWAEGKHIWAQQEVPWSGPLFEQLGEMTGKMHRLAQHFQFRHSCSERPHWYEEPGQNIRQYIPRDDEIIARKYDRLNYQIRQIDQNPKDYGLIHYDLHRGNFFIDRGKVTLFDFDDCQYHLFIADIAIAVFYAIPFDRTEVEQRQATEVFFRHFMKGYLRVHTIDRKWMNWMPALMKQREIDLYAAMYRSFDMSDLDSMDRWSQNFLQSRRTRLLNDVAVIKLDWLALYDEAVESREVMA